MIISNYEKKKIKRLEEKNIVCETLYHNYGEKQLVRSTDGKMLENIHSNPIWEKRYFINDECVYTVKNFNLTVLYTINSYDNESDIITCPSCGNKGEAKEFINGCPFCRTDFNFGMNNENTSHSTIIAKWDKTWLYIYLFLIVVFLFIYYVLNIHIVDVGFGFIYTFLISVVVYVIYVLGFRRDKYPAIKVPDADFDSSKDEDQFYSDLNKSLINYLYKEENLIDFDILENYGFSNITKDNMEITLTIRKVYYDTKFSKTTAKYKISMKYVDGKKVENNHGVLKCPSCGSSIDSSETVCKYCKNEVYYNRDWVIDKIEKV